MRLHGSGVTFTFGVAAPVDECVTVTSEDRPVSATVTAPGEADAVQDVAPKISARLLRAYAADGDYVRGHAA